MPSPAQATGHAGRQAPAGAPAAPNGGAAEGGNGLVAADAADVAERAAPTNGASTAPGTPTGPAAPDTPAAPGTRRRGELPDWALAAVTAVITLPILWMGYGTDVDIFDVREVGRLIRHFDYRPSRTPGVPVYESVVALFDSAPLGHIAVNLASALAAGAAVVGIARLVRTFGRPNGDLVALAFLASPIALVAATSTSDFIWAIAFFVWAAYCHLHDRPIVAGLLFALAIGSRSSTLIVIVAFLLADAWAPARRLRCLQTAAVMVPLAGLLYVPSWLAFDRTFGFLEHTEGWRGLKNNVGRFAYKNYYVAGPALILLSLACVPALVRSLRAWNRDTMVRVGFLGLASTELLFLQVPWKPAHLLPALLMFLLWVAATTRNRRPFLYLLIGVIAVNGIVAVRPLTPDTPDASQTADFNPTVMAGHLVNDIRCRLRYMDVEPEILNGAWFCSLEPMRGPTVIDHGVVPVDVVPTTQPPAPAP
jgi:hypothetical protein